MSAKNIRSRSAGVTADVKGRTAGSKDGCCAAAAAVTGTQQIIRVVGASVNTVVGFVGWGKLLCEIAPDCVSSGFPGANKNWNPRFVIKCTGVQL
jgi:hypothetical protein